MGRVPPLQFLLQKLHHSRQQLFVNKKKNLSEEERILIFKNLYLLKGYGAKRLTKEFPTKAWKKTMLNDFLPKRDYITFGYKLQN